MRDENSELELAYRQDAYSSRIGMMAGMSKPNSLKASQTLRHNLVQLRREKRLSLERLAEYAGVSRSMLGQIETGRSVPTVDTAERIANGLKVPLHDLIREIG